MESTSSGPHRPQHSNDYPASQHPTGSPGPQTPPPGSYLANKFEPPSASADWTEPPPASAGNHVGPSPMPYPPSHAVNNAVPSAYPSPVPGSPTPGIYTAPPGGANLWAASASPNSRRSRVLLIVGVAMIALATAFAICAYFTPYYYVEDSPVTFRDAPYWYFYFTAQVVLPVASILLLAFRKSRFWDKVKLAIGTVPLTLGVLIFADWLSLISFVDDRAGPGTYFRLAAAILLICGPVLVIVAVMTETPRHQLSALAATGSAAPAFAAPATFATPATFGNPAAFRTQPVFRPGNSGQAQPPAGTAP